MLMWELLIILCSVSCLCLVYLIDVCIIRFCRFTMAVPVAGVGSGVSQVRAPLRV